MTEVRRLVADKSGERLDVFVARLLPDLTRSRVRRLIDAGLVAVDERQPSKAGVTLEPGQRVEVTLPPTEPSHIEAEPIPLRIVYEDGDLLVVDKPAGMTVHPAPGHPRHTLVNAVLAHCSDLSGIGGERRPGIVHRLDKDTSGLIIVAKNDVAHLSLAGQLKRRRVEKAYLALVEGHIDPAQGLIDAPVGRHPVHRKRMAVVENGRDSRTRYRVLREVGGYSLVEVKPETGRTHQIRVHLASIGHPIVGDPLYGRGTDAPGSLGRQFLHAFRLAFRHPRSGDRLELEAPLPEELQRALDALERG